MGKIIPLIPDGISNTTPLDIDDSRCDLFKQKQSTTIVLTYLLLANIYPCQGMWVSCQWLVVRRWFLLGTPVPYTSYNWLVTTSPQYGRKSDEKIQYRYWYLRYDFSKQKQGKTIVLRGLES